MQPLGMVEAVLKQTGVEREQVEAIAVGLGPGSYNGIRVAIALAQGWQLASGVKLLGVAARSAWRRRRSADGIQGKFSIVIERATRRVLCRGL